MTTRTSKGNTYKTTWAYGPMRGTAQMMLEIEDERTISELAAEFEGCAEIRVRNGETEASPVTVYEGYTKLTGITRDDDGSVRITLEQPKE